MSAPFATLVEYWFGDLPPEEETQFEDHLFGCAECTARLDELAALGAAVRAAFRSGAVRAVVSRALLAAMKKEGLRLREYRMGPGGSVECTIAAQDDFVVGRLEAPLAGVQRVDLESMGQRLEDVPFDAEAGEIIVVPAPQDIRSRPAHTERVRLLAVEGDGERLLGEYSFVHTPS